MADKKYVGNGKEVGKFGQIKIGLRFADLPDANERGYINLIVTKMREPNKSGDTFCVYVDDWTPGAARDQRSEERQESQRQSFQPDDKLPF